MRQIFASIFGLLALLIVESPAAQTIYPEKPIRLIVPRPAGAPADTVARLLGQIFSGTLGKPVVVENVAGAAGNIAADRVAKSAPDGHTLGLMAESQIVVNPSLYKLAYDPVKDFAPVSQVTVFANMLVVHNAVPANNVQELIKLARARPGELTFASGGSGGSMHLAAELFKSVAGLDILHVPYKSGGAAIPDLLGGRVTMMFSPIASVLPPVREGKLRGLAVTSLRRSAAAPELPTIAESGFPGFEGTSWHGLLAPARTPAMIVGKIYFETVRALAVPDVHFKLAALGMEAIGSSPDEFAAVIKSGIPKWAKVIKNAGIKAD
jgi:tripartite-type tricarboxylate transporter receptor subunit TctC